MRTTIKLILALFMAFSASCAKSPAPNKPADVDHYTCTMHPFVNANAPGKCPVCGMNLVPVMKSGASPLAPNESKRSGKKEFVVPVQRQQQIGVTYATVERRTLQKKVRAVGSVAIDSQKRWVFVARVEGYVQQLFVASPGQIVEKDQPLLSIYSPELLTTERELLMLLRMRDEASSASARETPGQLIAAAKARLQQWNITPEQIADLEKNRTPSNVITLRSPFRGVVQELPAAQGANVKMGDRLVEVADLSAVWVWAEFYETELDALQIGQKVTVTSRALPNEKLEGEIALINPFVEETKRTSRIRVDIANPDFKLRPGMYADVTLSVSGGEQLAVPVSAIMPTGGRNIAFVDKGEGKLEPREVKLAGQFGDCFAVASGLTNGEHVVTSANFLIDAEAKVQGALEGFESTEAVR